MAQDSCFGTSTMKPAAAVAEETRRERAVRLFGVSILAVEEVEGVGEVMRKCSSTGNLVSAAAIATGRDQAHYLSDSSLDRFPRRRRRGNQERKRGVPWTEEEHRSFLAGLENLGKGDWRGISREFVITRTPTQVASHAQKFFMRKNNPSASARKRRSSLFDVVISCQGDATTTKAAERKTEEGNLPHLIRPASSIETKDLELRIALPEAHNLNKLCTHGAAGAISAI